MLETLAAMLVGGLVLVVLVVWVGISLRGHAKSAVTRNGPSGYEDGEGPTMIGAVCQFYLGQLTPGEEFAAVGVQALVGKVRGAMGSIGVSTHDRLIIGNIENGSAPLVWGPRHRPRVRMLGKTGGQLAGMQGLEAAVVVRIAGGDGRVADVVTTETFARALEQWAASA